MAKIRLKVRKTAAVERELRTMLIGMTVDAWLKGHAKDFADRFLRDGQVGLASYYVKLGGGVDLRANVDLVGDVVLVDFVEIT